MKEASYRPPRSLDRADRLEGTLDGVSGVASLRGVAMPWADVVRNAGAFAGALGLRVLEE